MALALPSSTATSTSSFSSNFLGNPFWISPNFTHSIFSAQVINKQCFKSNSWIIDTWATDHMVHSVSQLTTITSIIHSCVYLPNGEKAVVTHIDTVQISSTLTLTNVCVSLPSVSILFLLANLLRPNIVALFFLVIGVSSRTLLNGALLVQVRKAMVYTYFKLLFLLQIQLLLPPLSVIFLQICGILDQVTLLQPDFNC